MVEMPNHMSGYQVYMHGWFQLFVLNAVTACCWNYLYLLNSMLKAALKRGSSAVTKVSLPSISSDRVMSTSVPDWDFFAFKRGVILLYWSSPCWINSCLNNNYVFTQERRQRDKRLWKWMHFRCHMLGLIYWWVKKFPSPLFLTSNKQLAPIIPQPRKREIFFSLLSFFSCSLKPWLIFCSQFCCKSSQGLQFAHTLLEMLLQWQSLGQ